MTIRAVAPQTVMPPHCLGELPAQAAEAPADDAPRPTFLSGPSRSRARGDAFRRARRWPHRNLAVSRAYSNYRPHANEFRPDQGLGGTSSTRSCRHAEQASVLDRCGLVWVSAARGCLEAPVWFEIHGALAAGGARRRDHVPRTGEFRRRSGQPATPRPHLTTSILRLPAMGPLRGSQASSRKPIPSETGDAGTVDLTVRRGGLEAV
jgi:hypothetical protein